MLHVWRGRELKPPTYHVATALFLRLLGLVYLIAFVSLWTQIDGLVGDHGILPASSYLDAVKLHCTQAQPPLSPVWQLPTLAWISPHDAFLNLLCAAGTILSCLLIVGVLPLPALVLLWISYLSLFHVGQDFLSFQWDILLLETGFVAIFLAPFAWRSRLRTDPHPPRLAIWLVWWLLFRLMFESGAVKLTWNHGLAGPDGLPVPNTWQLLTALDFHYWTQPLPIWTSWYAAKLPHWFQALSVVAVLGVELVLPWFIVGPRYLRYVACAGFTLLMLLISATGNYNFFNLLTIALALTLVDDRAWPRWMQTRISGDDAPWLFSPTRWRSVLLVPFFALSIAIGTQQVIEAAFPAAEPTESLASRLDVRQFCLVNDYGLFRRMTETRPEIILEGSNDGTDWKPYQFRWKPGDLDQPPRFNMPHQPRLDWQMWFEALRLEQVVAATGSIDPRYLSPWFRSSCRDCSKASQKCSRYWPKTPSRTHPQNSSASPSINTASPTRKNGWPPATGGTANSSPQVPRGPSKSSRLKVVPPRPRVINLPTPIPPVLYHNLAASLATRVLFSPITRITRNHRFPKFIHESPRQPMFAATIRRTDVSYPATPDHGAAAERATVSLPNPLECGYNSTVDAS